jgi:hypothetical protein
MSVHLFDGSIANAPSEPMLLEEIAVRLIESSERERFDEELTTKHYLKNANAVRRVLRYVAEYRGQWVALLVFSSAAFHIKVRDRWLHWSPHQIKERRHLIAQNARFLVLSAPGKWPNLGSKVLKLACERLPQDWQEHFGYPVQVVETFVDPLRFRGTCYKAAGWEQLGPTGGFQGDWQDFYTDTQHPKQSWVRPLTDKALEQVRALELPSAWADPEGPVPPPCPVPTAQLNSLWECLHQQMPDPRKPKGVRHKLAESRGTSCSPYSFCRHKDFVTRRGTNRSFFVCGFHKPAGKPMDKFVSHMRHEFVLAVPGLLPTIASIG